MIGKQEWFIRRKWLGWGIMPAKWQGWVYVLIFLAPIVIINYFLILENNIRLSITIIWIVIFIADVIHIMATMNKDEREKIHEAIAERNALWVIIFVLALGAVYQASSSGMTNNSIGQIDPVILIALVAGLIAKATSNFYLDKKD